MEALLGASLRSKARGSVATTSALAGSRFVLVYCSASWCPPCRSFTPVLADFFTAHAARRRAAFVLLSCDRDDASFQAYWKKMPWELGLSPEDSAGQALMAKFGIKGIPALLVFSSSGALVTASGVEGLSRDPTGSQFPWVGPGGTDIGRRVTLRGLAARPELNGQTGLVEKVVAPSGRLQVAIAGEVVAVKRDNVEFLDAE